MPAPEPTADSVTCLGTRATRQRDSKLSHTHFMRRYCLRASIKYTTEGAASKMTADQAPLYGLHYIYLA